ncbi:putative clathrin assembly protein At2g25430 [Diospyros lotus]|uniref:putative clathrin assembly protein At2g25430 n=1 Tax=Diospyros lotus TaxID=55363 RepID=UPI00225B6998|nr:putative clathrin assembly protein At2g25430 [Diospyros lotus]
MLLHPKQNQTPPTSDSQKNTLSFSLTFFATMQRKFKQAFTAMREHGYVSYAKMATMGGFCDLDLIVVKATAPVDLPLPERYVHQLLKIFSISPASFRPFSISFTRRFGKTQCWRVALKCLVLLHRLLRSLPENSPFRAELLWTRSNGLLSLYPCHFRDSSSSSSEDYTVFIRSYAHLLDEALLHVNEEEKQEEGIASLAEKMQEVARLTEILPELQSMIDRVMDCRPTGAVARSFLVQSAMKHIIRDSFACYTSFRRDVVLVLENLMQMPYRSCVEAFGIYKKAAVQANQLCEFYDWCKSLGLCGCYEYPFIDRIPHIQVTALERLLNGMWQLTDTSSSPVSPLTCAVESSSLTEDESERQGPGSEIVAGGLYCPKFEDDYLSKKLEGDEEIEPLIQFVEGDNNVGWEELLEASTSLEWEGSRHFLFGGYGHEYRYNLGGGQCEQANGWQLQVYNPPVNPFSQQPEIPNYYPSFAANPLYPWGI